MERNKRRIFSDPNIPISQIYALRVFALEEGGQYGCWPYFTFGEAWAAFTIMMECMDATFVGGCIDHNGHRYFAKANGVGLQLTPFFYHPNGVEAYEEE